MIFMKIQILNQEMPHLFKNAFLCKSTPEKSYRKEHMIWFDFRLVQKL